jgi:predicted transposase/invertase (TIGR01784 family)
LPENAGSGMREQWIKFLSVKTGKELDMIEKANYDYNSGMARSRSLGMEEGIAEAKAEDAKKMKAKGCDNAFIAEITGLSVEQIERL